MRHIINMSNLITLFALLVLTSSCCNCKEPAQLEQPVAAKIPQLPKDNTFRAKFKATPDSFSVYGGSGEISGVLQEISPEGEIVNETPLKRDEYSLTAMQPLDVDIIKGWHFRIHEDWKAACFVIKAEVISGKGKGCSEYLKVSREGVELYFRAEPNRFTSKGGVGKLMATVRTVKHDGTIVKETERDAKGMVIGVGSDDEGKGITIDHEERTFTIAEGGEATFWIEISTGYSPVSAISITREGQSPRPLFRADVTILDDLDDGNYYDGVSLIATQEIHKL